MKKIIALLLALVMVFGLVACGAPGIDNIDDIVNIKPGKNDANQSADGEYVPANIGPNGEKLRVTRVGSSDWDGALPLVQPGEDNKLTIGIRTNANILDFETNEYTLWLEEQTGLDLEFVVFGANSSDAATQISLMVAGGEELPDILISFSGIGKTLAKEYGNDGYLVDMSSYYMTDAYYMNQALDLYYPDPAEREEFESFLLANITDPLTNNMFWYPIVWQNPGDTNLSHIWINQDWLDSLGLTAPTTVDELYDVLVAFRDQDPNGNGTKDEIPMIGRMSDQFAIVQWVINAFTYHYAKYKFHVEDGVVSAPFHTDEYREAVIFLRKLVDEGLLSPLTWTASKEELTALINPTGDFTVGITAAPGDVHFEQNHQSMYVYEPLGPLADATGKGGWAPTSPDLVSYPNFITLDCENPRLAFRFLDFMNTPEAYLRGRWGVPGRDWKYLDEPVEGSGMLGGPARIEVINDKVSSEVNNITWHSNTVGLSSEKYWQKLVNFGDGSWSAEMYDDLQQIIANYENGKQPEENLYVVERSEEDNEAYTDANSDIQSYYSTALAEFCNGIRNPSSDADWNKYLSDLEGLGYYDIWLPIAQKSYDQQISH